METKKLRATNFDNIVIAKVGKYTDGVTVVNNELHILSPDETLKDVKERYNPYFYSLLEFEFIEAYEADVEVMRSAGDCDFSITYQISINGLVLGYQYHPQSVNRYFMYLITTDDHYHRNYYRELVRQHKDLTTRKNEQHEANKQRVSKQLEIIKQTL